MRRIPRPFESRNLLNLAGLATAAALLSLQAGCIFSPDRGKTPPQPPPMQYLIPSTPQAVLNNLIKAYADRDTLPYRQCYDLSYIGHSYGAYDSTGSFTPGDYSYDSEAHHIAALHRSTTIFHVSLDLPNYQAARMDTFPADPAGVVSMSIYNPQVQIDDASGSIGILTGEVFSYKFVPEAVSTKVSPTGKLWKIYAWTEIAPAAP